MRLHAPRRKCSPYHASRSAEDLGARVYPLTPLLGRQGPCMWPSFLPHCKPGRTRFLTCASISAFALHRQQHGVRVSVEVVRLAAIERVPSQLGLTVRA